MDSTRVFSATAPRNAALTAITSLLLLFGVGCANYGSRMNSVPGVPAAPATAVAQFRMGDGPADRVISFEMTVGLARLNLSSGSQCSVIFSLLLIELF